VSPPLAIPLPGPLQTAYFVDRPNRFAVHVRLLSPDGPLVLAHLADPGRLRELLVPGAAMRVRPAGGPGRTTAWSAVLVEAPGGEPVPVDTSLAGRLVREALRREALAELAGWRLDRAEVAIGGSRIDYLLADAAGRSLALEVKAVSLLRDDVACFPDAVTARGRRHLLDLAGRADAGEAAAVLFVVQRAGARTVRAATDIDPAFALALKRAGAAGVRLLAREALVSGGELRLGAPVPVEDA
jgi:sugar fermentation stimulation protein A